MAFTDPQSITINAVPYSLPRTASSPSGVFTNPEQTVKVTVSHQTGRRTRRALRVDFSKIASDPLTAENAEFSMSATLVVDIPNRGLTVTEQKQVVDGLTAYLTASSGASVTRLLGGES